MEVLLIVLLAVVVVLALFLWRQRRVRAKKRAEAADQAARADQDLKYTPTGVFSSDPTKLKLNDQLDYDVDGRSYEVQGVASFNDGAYRWRELYLTAADGTCRWLSIDEAARHTTIIMWAELGSEAEDLQPNSVQIAFGGIVYDCEERSTAEYKVEGTSNLPDASGQLSYVDYQSDVYYLSFERFDLDGKWEVSSGLEVATGSLTIYPAPAM